MTWTELHDACEHQDASRVIQGAHTHYEDALELDEHGWTPLHVLCWGNPSIEAVQALLQACPQSASAKDAHNDTPLHVACSYKETDKHLVQVLLEACPTAASMANREDLMPLHMACRHAPDNAGVIGLLIDTYPYALRAHIKVGVNSSRVSIRTFIRFVMTL
jgi:ankyrin repeat protein